MHRGVLLGIAALLCSCAHTPTELPKNATTVSRNFQDERLQGVLDLTSNGQLSEASVVLNTILQDYPKEPFLHLINGILYEEMAAKGDPTKLELSGVAYKNAFTHDPANWYAFYRMGRYKLKSRQYQDAQNYYAQALLINPNHIPSLHDFASASYYAEDLAAAKIAIQKALALKEGSQDVSLNRSAAMIFAATGDLYSADEKFINFAKYAHSPRELSFFSSRLQDWQRFHEKNKPLLHKAASIQETVVKAAPQPPAPPESDKRMAIFDCYFLRVSEEGGTSKGANVLDLLTTTLNLGDPVSSDGADGTDGAGAAAVSVAKNLLSWGSIKYNLNIANAKSNRVQVVGRPTLTAYLNKGASFESGLDLVAGVTGGMSSGFVSTTSIGAFLNITPHAITDDSVRFSISLRASILAKHDAEKAITDQILTVNQTKIQTDLEVRFDETAMLGGLYQRTDSDTKSGVPFLQSIPIIQYFFSSENKVSEKRSILFLVTPRRASTYQGRIRQQILKRQDRRASSVQELLKDSDALFTDSKSTLNITELIVYLAPLYRELRQGDLGIYRPEIGESISQEMTKALEFLHF